MGLPRGNRRDLVPSTFRGAVTPGIVFLESSFVIWLAHGFHSGILRRFFDESRNWAPTGLVLGSWAQYWARKSSAGLMIYHNLVTDPKPRVWVTTTTGLWLLLPLWVVMGHPSPCVEWWWWVMSACVWDHTLTLCVEYVTIHWSWYSLCDYS